MRIKNVMTVLAAMLLAACGGEAKFAKGAAGDGVSVAITPDGCAASLIIGDGQLISENGERMSAEKQLPLKLKHGPASLRIDGRGAKDGEASTAALLRLGNSTVPLFDKISPNEGVWAASHERANVAGFSSASLAYSMTPNSRGAGEAPIFSVDSIDLVIVGCDDK